VNRRTLDGDFLLASADKLPFRPNTIDAAVMLGTLHHLALHGPSLERVVETVRPGGLIGLDEVIARHGLTDRMRPWRRSGDSPNESLHNEFVDATTVRRTLEENAEVLEWHRIYSPVRGLLDRLLSNKMRTRPWLSRLVFGIDSAIRATIGRVWEVFLGSELLVLARRNEPRETRSC
jgi:SAM-dependent methyltransferase